MPKFSAYMKGGDGIVGPPGASFISGIVATTTQLPPDPPENRRIYLVGDSDPKYIYAYIDGEWVNQGLTASEVARADASISSVSWTEDPSVQVSFSTENQKDFFHFDFTVPKTRPAGFGTSSSASATTIAFGATPTVSVSTSGEDYAKNFHFGFGIPAGEPAGFGTISATTNQIAYNDTPSVEVIAVTSSPERAKQFNFKFNIPEAYPGKAAIDSLTTRVESISTNFVNKTGDSMSGNLTIQNSKMLYLESSTTAGLQQARIYLRPKGESNSNNLSFWYSEYDNHGAQLYQLPDYDETSSHANYYYKILTSKTPVTIEQGGTGATTSTAARTNLGVVSNNGDTVIGDYSIKNLTADSTVKPSSNIVSNIRFKDKNDVTTGILRSGVNSSGRVVIELLAHRAINNVDYYNNLSLAINDDGTPFIYVEHPATWREAIGAVNIAGDTMTGNLYIQKSANPALVLKATAASTGVAPSSNANLGTLYFFDKNNSTMGTIQGFQLTTNDVRLEMKVQNGSYSNYFRLLSNSTGTATVVFSHPAAWKTALGLTKTDIPTLDYLPLSGGTITNGGISITGSNCQLVITDTRYNTESTISATTYNVFNSLKDSKNRYVAWMQVTEYPNGGCRLSLASRVYNSSSLDNSLDLHVDRDGTRTVNLYPSAWAKAIFNTDNNTHYTNFLTLYNGFNTPGYISFNTLKTDLGLVVSTANATMNSTNTSTGTIVCRKWGKVVSVVTTTAFQLKADLTSGSIAVATIPEGYRPSTNQLCLIGTTTIIGFGYIDTSGTFTVFKPSYANVPKTTSIYLYATYVLTS